MTAIHRPDASKPLRLVLTGLGNIGLSLLRILQSQADLLQQRYGLSVSVVGAADSAGAALDPAGLTLDTVLACKAAKRSVGTLHGVGRPGMSGLQLVQSIDADVLMESTLVNLTDGQPGLAITTAALHKSWQVILANKGPLVMAFAELAALSDLGTRGAPGLRFSGAVGGAMPTINIGRRDLAGSRITKIEAVLNGTTQGILRLMENPQSAMSYAAALKQMQSQGIAEADPTLDVEGWDAANKLVIIANAVLRTPAKLADVRLQGITQLTVEQLRAALARGQRIMLLCLAEQNSGQWRFSVQPTALPLTHPLARMGADEMGVMYHTDISGIVTATSAESGPEPTSAAMLRDLIELNAV